MHKSGYESLRLSKQCGTGYHLNRFREKTAALVVKIARFNTCQICYMPNSLKVVPANSIGLKVFRWWAGLFSHVVTGFFCRTFASCREHKRCTLYTYMIMYIDKQATLDALHFQPDAKILKNPVVACLFALCVT